MSTKTERRARLAEVQAAEQKAARRRRLLTTAVVAAVAAALVIPAAVIIISEQRRQSALQEAAQEPLPGVVEVPDLDVGHVTTDVEYGTLLPPMGGPHDPVWQDCGFYDQPVRNENAVHSLEHGAVWLAYDPVLPSDEVSTLRALAAEHDYLLVSPYEDLVGPLVATAWGVQLELDSTQDERLEIFLLQYLQGPQTPEPGAPCSGGTSAPL